MLLVGRYGAAEGYSSRQVLSMVVWWRLEELIVSGRLKGLEYLVAAEGGSVQYSVKVLGGGERPASHDSRCRMFLQRPSPKPASRSTVE